MIWDDDGRPVGPHSGLDSGADRAHRSGMYARGMLYGACGGLASAPARTYVYRQPAGFIRVRSSSAGRGAYGGRWVQRPPHMETGTGGTPSAARMCVRGGGRRWAPGFRIRTRRRHKVVATGEGVLGSQRIIGETGWLATACLRISVCGGS